MLGLRSPIRRGRFRYPLVSVIVIAYGHLDQVKRLISSIQRQKHRNLEVILVDNMRSKELQSYVERKNGEWSFRVLYLPSLNIGHAGGNVLGLRYAKGEYLFLLNPDTWLERDTISTLCRKFGVERDTVMVLVPKVMIGNSNRIHSVGQTRWRWNLYVNLGQGEEDVGQYDDPKFVEAFDGAAVMFREAFLQHTFLFDPTFFQGQESVDLAERIRALGFQIRTCPKAVVHHKIGGTMDAKTRDRMRVLLVRNSLVHTLRNKGWWTFLGTLLFAVCWSNIYWPIKNRNLKWATINARGILRFIRDFGLFERAPVNALPRPTPLDPQA